MYFNKVIYNFNTMTRKCFEHFALFEILRNLAEGLMPNLVRIFETVHFTYSKKDVMIQNFIIY